jgi:hypothetical protein
MLITYIRSSSYNNWDFCQMQYYLNYVLGMPRSSSKKADQGTIVHKVMEVLANCKKSMQETPIFDPPILQDSYYFDDEHIGKVIWTEEDFLKPTALSNEHVDKINKTRINKDKYKHDAHIPYNTVHYGVDMVEDIFERAYDYYSEEDWYPVDKKDCRNWTWMVLEYKDGIFDPRKQTIWEAEPHFDFEIDRPWANYEWELPSGEKISGKLAIKGTIDLLISHEGGILEICDWKTGQRKDWGEKIESKSRKTYSKLCTDFQLMMYYYAARKLYPEAKQVIVSIFFVRDGGPFTICLDDDSIKEVEERLQKRFQEIASCQYPMMQDATQRDFRCARICDYFKMESPDPNKNMCRFIHDEIELVGIDEVTKKHTCKGFSVGVYNAPGEKE